MVGDWRPIKDYETDAVALADGELRALSSVWIEQKTALGESVGIKRFHERLHREWAIETGLIERLYTLDQGTTEMMIRHGVDASYIPHRVAQDPQRTVALIGDQQDAIESLFAFVKGDRQLSTSYIKELHSLFTRNQPYVEGRDQFGQITRLPLLRGEYKKQPNNPTRVDGTTHQYCPPEHVAAEMDNLITMHAGHVNVAPEAEAAWLHHRFAQIHPFQDGNGRLARALASLVFIKAEWMPLVVRDDERKRYIGALEAADGGDLHPLVRFFASVQRQQFIRVIGIAKDVAQSVRVESRIQAIGKQLSERRDALVLEWETAVDNAEHLRRFAVARLEEVKGMLDQAVGEEGEFKIFVRHAGDRDRNSHYFRRQIIATAKALGYYATTSRHRAWACLGIHDSSKSDLLFSFHGIGHEFRGVLACSASWQQRVPTDDGGMEPGGHSPLCDEVFQINYKEHVTDIQSRFEDWLERALERGLAMWQQSML